MTSALLWTDVRSATVTIPLVYPLRDLGSGHTGYSFHGRKVDLILTKSTLISA